ncbi:MAG: MBL fold metallo-hydrolase [Burkholderiales bacterium]|nr:MBL fold metallo-hydrolase [Burkholderiales bacterium]
MARLSQLLHTPREPAHPRPAATVLLLRDAPGGFEVLMTRRSAAARFVPGAYVFPGGAIDAADAQAHTLSTRRPGQSDLALTQAVAALRESFEEVGILVAHHADGRPVSATDVAALDRQAPFNEQIARHGLTLAGADVYVLAHWVTDRDLPRRFDVPFLVARVPEGQVPEADNTEQFEPVWVRPAHALAEHAAGRFFMIFPTIRTLEQLQHHASVQALLDACAISEDPLFSSCPRAGLLGGKEARYMEHEPPFGELELVCPDGQLLHPLDWNSQRPVSLLKNVQRLTAPNAGVMTGPGTNSYLVGDPATGHIAIDPGPDDPEHIERLWRAAGGRIAAIVCTHSHPDHSPGARRLQALCASSAAAGEAPPPILGLASGPTSRRDSQFTPDRNLQNNELLTLTQQAQTAENTQKISATHTLKVIHTPGHASNHLCLVLLEDGLLFSGDHILNGSTTVIDPPDGNMHDYLQSLDTLAAACTEHGITHILPAHGYALGQARQAIEQLRQHRLKREAKVLSAMQTLPQGSLQDWVKLAYQDVPERLWPVAERSLLAHVQRIRTLGLT